MGRVDPRREEGHIRGEARMRRRLHDRREVPGAKGGNARRVRVAVNFIHHARFLLTCLICAYLTTLMDSSSEFQHLSFAPGVTVEGQFLASLAPQRERTSACSCPGPSIFSSQTTSPASAPLLEKRTKNEREEEAISRGTGQDYTHAQRFWHVLVNLSPPLCTPQLFFPPMLFSPFLLSHNKMSIVVLVHGTMQHRCNSVRLC